LTAAAEALDLARALIRCPSVTPDEGGTLGVLESALKPLGFDCHRLPFSTAGTPDVDNLYARAGSGGKHLCFAGHVDVVPVGDRRGWTVDPFAAEIVDGVLYGRGAADMKSAIAAMVTAMAQVRAARGGWPGRLSLLLTGDEEGPAINGTTRMLDWMEAKGERADVCVVGEPTCQKRLGDMIKIGRRGSLNAVVTVKGAQGHVAYPHLADNPIPRLIETARALDGRVLDEGNAWFQPSNLEITSIDVGNPATNLIPGLASLRLNIRFNDRHSGAALSRWIAETCAQHAGAHELDIAISGESFLTQPGALSDLVASAIRKVTGIAAELSTTGGTSDARFIRRHCPVVEFGLVGQTMHKVDERCAVEDIAALTRIYRTLIEDYFAP